MYRPTVMLLLLIVCVNTNTHAQHPYFESYHLLKKNDPVQVNVVHQSRGGFIWLGTDRGLFRFDGIDFTWFATADSLPDENVTAIEEDSTGRLWLGHRNGMLSILDHGKISRFDPPEGSAAGEVSDILFDSRGHLWFSTLNDGLYYFVNDRLFRVDEHEGLPDLFVYEMVEDDKGQIWAGTDGGLVICKLDGQKVTVTTLTDRGGLPDNIIKCLAFVSGKVWVGTEDKGIFSYDPSIARFVPLIDKVWSFGPVTDFQFKDNEAWVSCPQTGLVRFDTGSRVCSVMNQPEGVKFIRNISVDAEGNIWLATKTGVMRTPGSGIELLTDFEPGADPNVVALTLDAEDRLWFATREGLFASHLDGYGRTVCNRFPLPPEMIKEGIISLHHDDAGHLWAGLYGAGVLLINPVTKQVTRISKELRNGSVLNITSRGDDIWLATLGGATRMRRTGKGLDVKNYSQQDGLISDYIYQVFVDHQGGVWFATDRAGIDRLDAAGIHHFKEGLATKVVYGFAETGVELWANVQGEGLFRFDGVRFQPTLSQQLRDQNINVFTTDSSGNLVIGHDLGIDVCLKGTSRILSLGEENGISNMHPNLNAVAKDRRGNIFIGTDHGIIRYKPDSRHGQRPKPILESMRVNNQNVSLADRINLSYDENTIALTYVGFWFQNPGSLKYQYRLDGHDHDWIMSRDRTVIYSSLEPGQYTFRLRVSDTENFDDSAEVTATFVIRPPFWKTIWFYISATAALTFGVYLYVRYRERKLEKEKKVLEEMVAERTREIQAMNDEILAQNEEIQSQADEIKEINEHLEEMVSKRTRELEKKNLALEEYAFINAHKLRAPVASILGLINLIHKTELDRESREIVEHLNTSARKLDEVVTSITEAIERGSIDFPT